jgi:tRNA nucleotidyltransferase/poly(A) polymerase
LWCVFQKPLQQISFKQISEIISQASQELNVDSYVIGGFVRDLILNRDFKKDIDIVAAWIKLALKFLNYFQNNQKYKFSRRMVPPCVLKIRTLNLLKERILPF